MSPSYPFLGDIQPKTLSATENLLFGSLDIMVNKAAQELGNRIRKRRTKLKLSQPELGEILDVPQQTIDGWEHGKARRPRYLLELSKALCTTQEWLLTGEGDEHVVSASKAELSTALNALDPNLVPAAMEFLRKLGKKTTEAA